MSDFDLDWGMEHDLHVDHDGGVDHVLADDHHQYDQHDQHDYADNGDLHDVPDLGEIDHQHDEPLGFDEPDLEVPEWQLDTDFLDSGHYDLVGADPDEHDMWSQFMTDMHEEVNPYAAS
ncbi:hypothetical protein [Dactylosporangium darangshiense]